MKNLSLIINAVLAVAIVVLFVLVLSNKSNSATKHAVTGKDTIISGKLPIAYVNVDSLLLHYQFAKDANESLIRKQEESRASVNSKAIQFKKERDEFQRKYQANAFISHDRAEQEAARIEKMDLDLRKLDEELSKNLMQIQQKMSEQLRDTINVFFKGFNKDHKYQMIISNTSNDNILYADKGYDITEEVTKALNERYAAKK